MGISGLGSSQTSQRGEGGVGFLVCECLVSEVEFISQVNYDEFVVEVAW